MQIHLCLVSEQTVPNVLGIARFAPDWVLFCTTQAMEARGKSDAILAALACHGLDYADRHQRIVINPNSYDDCERAFAGIARDHVDNNLVVNLTGGTKIMALAAAAVFRGEGSRQIYTPIPRNEYITLHPRDGRTTQTHALPLRLSVDAFTSACGIRVNNSEEARFLSQSAAENEPLSNFIAERYRELENLLGEFFFRFKDLREHATARAPFTWQIRNPAEKQLLELLGAPSGRVERPFNKYEIRFITGDWLSDFCYNQVRKLRVDDCVTGIELIDDDQAKNEFDVLFTKDNALFIVECKSLKQKSDKDAAILYKISALQQNFGLRANGFLVTTARSILDGRGKLKRTVLQRAAQCETQVLHPDSIPQFGAWLKERIRGL